MLRSIVSALLAGLKRTFRFVGDVLSAPLTMFGGGAPAPIDIRDVAEPQPHVPPPEDRTQMYLDVARAIMNWAADSVLADRPVDLPPRLPIAVREWLPGLSREECWALMDSSKMSVLGHISGESLIRGLRPVRRLPRITAWPAAPVVPESTGFAAIAALEELEPDRA